MGYQVSWTGFAEEIKIIIPVDSSGDPILPEPIINYRKGKTLWDWYVVLLGISIAAALAIMNQFSTNRRKLDRELIEIDRQRESIFQKFLDDISALLLDRKLLAKKHKRNPSVVNIARIKIITTLRELGDDIDRKNSLLMFIVDSQLADFILQDASLESINLSGTYVGNINFNNSRLYNADFSNAFLIDTQFMNSKMDNANFTKSEIVKVNFSNAVLKDVRFNGATIYQSGFESANLEGASIEWELMNDVVDFNKAILPDRTVYDRKKYEKDLFGRFSSA